jgi:hypothetical protein
MSPVSTDPAPASYTNRHGSTFYLHEGKTKTGKPRYFVAKTIGESARPTMPDGFEFAESVNGVVSVRKVDASAPRIPEADLAIVRTEMARHPHLRQHRVEAVKGEIVVFEPFGGISREGLAAASSIFGALPHSFEAQLAKMPSGARLTPVMKFVPQEGRGSYAVHRMTYRGRGGWSWPLGLGPLLKLARQYLKAVGTEDFFELY